MKKLLPVVWVGMLGAGVSAVLSAATAPQLEHGHSAFEYWCAPCHAREPREGGRLLPGTASLRAKYGTEKPAALEDRTDLVPDFTRAVVRRGVAGMPSFRKTEISERDLEDIAAYLAQHTPAP